jgi:exopolysaccharide production protein ExoY
LKRLLDLTLALFLLFLTLPAMAVIALLVTFTSPGGVLFCQRRVGRQGRLFWCLKFRTMVADADRWLCTTPSLRQQWQRHHKLRADPRVTPLGAILRKTSLDELPQLWNVLRGDMSLVGPRPLLPEELDEGGLVLARLLSVSPGLTGLAQIRGRSDLTFVQRLRYDVEYVRRRSLFLDLLLLLQTVPVVLSGRGAY